MKNRSLGLGLLLLLNFVPHLLCAATVTGTLRDISIQALNTKLMFAPTTNVLLTAAGLSAGPPKTIDTTNGQFTLVLEAGDYTLSLPLVTWRRPFTIFVPETNGTINITNLLTNPHMPGGGPAVLVHVNTNRVIAWSTNSASSLLDAAATLAAGTITAGRAFTVEAYGSVDDPSANSPNVSFQIKLGSTSLVTAEKAVSSGAWRLRGLVSLRSTGVSGAVVATLVIGLDDGGSFDVATQTATLDTTGALSFELTAETEDFTGTEQVACDQLMIRLE